MGKWLSQTKQIESKVQLKSHRKRRFDVLKGETDLIFAQSYAYTAQERQLADSLWAQADEDYEKRKTDLRKELTSLSSIDKTKYFEEIGIAKQKVNAYLPISPFTV